MSDKTPHYQWEIPSRGSRPWYDAFYALQTQVDATVFGLRDVYFPLTGGQIFGDIDIDGNRLSNANKIGIGIPDAGDIMGALHIKSPDNHVLIEDSSGDIDEKYWATRGKNGVYELLAADDAYTEWNPFIQMVRNGKDPESIVIPLAKLGIWKDNPQAKIDIGGIIGPKQFAVPVNNANADAGIGTIDVTDHSVMGIGVNCSFIGNVDTTKPGSCILFDTRDTLNNDLLTIITKSIGDVYTYPFKLKNGCPDNTIFLSDDGKIGLHTDTPEYSLDHTGDTRIKGTFRISKTNDHLVFDQITGALDEKLWVMKSEQNEFQFITANDTWTQWNEIFRVTRNGFIPSSFVINALKVGIGITDPEYAFDMIGDAKILGTLLINNPILDNHAATKIYVDQQISSAIHIGEDQPQSVFVGKLWAKLGEPVETALRIYWDDGNWHSFFMGGIVL